MLSNGTGLISFETKAESREKKLWYQTGIFIMIVVMKVLRSRVRSKGQTLGLLMRMGDSSRP